MKKVGFYLAEQKLQEKALNLGFLTRKYLPMILKNSSVKKIFFYKKILQKWKAMNLFDLNKIEILANQRK